MTTPSPSLPDPAESAEDGLPLPEQSRFAYVALHPAAAAPTAEEADEYARRAEEQNPGAWSALLREADAYAAVLAGPYRAALFRDGVQITNDSPVIPEVVLLASGLQSWALAGVRGLLHRYLAEDGAGPDDLTAVFLQGVLVGGAFVMTVGSDQVTAKGYRPPPFVPRNAPHPDVPREETP